MPLTRVMYLAKAEDKEQNKSPGGGESRHPSSREGLDLLSSDAPVPTLCRSP